ncbi:MerR family transcriptional regulator [Nocardioides terrisoli]|uniref:MerR family transcriptional regulator n=1 Tax=Nocardioides terrisoli TaxID=3388267 RepID=UPI00287B6D37|nr:MerR family transcriptional regulator [Nocardioides marmorisolisilvae]
MVDLEPGRGLFSISVTSELTGVNPQMLRAYEHKGLLAPHRTEGGTRRYSSHDLDRIDEITTLLSDGLNLAGIELVLQLRAENRRLQREIHRLRPNTACPSSTQRRTSPDRQNQRHNDQ